MYRFFVEPAQIQRNLVIIEGTDVNHIRNVLRMKVGESFLVSCGDEWEYTCKIKSLSEDGQAFRRTGEDVIIAEIVDAQKPGKELPSRIYLFQCLPKGDKMELIIQKAVELGAYEIIPVSSRRSIVKLDAKKAETKRKRWNMIAESAAKQSKRMIIPEVRGVCSLKEAFRQIREEQIDVCLIPYEMEAASMMEKTRRRMEAIRPGERIAILIGPEGGFDQEEVRLAEESGFQRISLGRRILRTETAGLATLSILTYLLDE